MLEAVYLACMRRWHSVGVVSRLAGHRPALVIQATNAGMIAGSGW